jgi:hypothetical protein
MIASPLSTRPEAAALIASSTEYSGILVRKEESNRRKPSQSDSDRSKRSASRRNNVLLSFTADIFIVEESISAELLFLDLSYKRQLPFASMVPVLIG